MNTSRKAFRRLFGVILSLLLLFTLSATPALAATSQIIYQGSTSNKVVALTFDDGSDGYNIQSILNTLSANNIKATFFLTGQGAENHPQAIKNIVSAGHDIGNHSYNHPDFTTVSTTEINSPEPKRSSRISPARAQNHFSALHSDPITVPSYKLSETPAILTRSSGLSIRSTGQGIQPLTSTTASSIIAYLEPSF
mgnify:CR=1 FL=1